MELPPETIGWPFGLDTVIVDATLRASDIGRLSTDRGVGRRQAENSTATD